MRFVKNINDTRVNIRESVIFVMNRVENENFSICVEGVCVRDIRFDACKYLRGCFEG